MRRGHIADCIMPTLSKSELKKEVSTLVFCILNDRPIDFATIISNKIYEIGNESRNDRCLGFPHLITKLVHNMLGARAPSIQNGIKLTTLFSLKLVQDMMSEQEAILILPWEEAKKSKGKKKV